MIGFFLIFICNAQKDKTENSFSKEKKDEQTEAIKGSKGELILNETIAAHGGDLYSKANYSFVFRGNIYHFKNNSNSYEYSKVSKTKNLLTQDFLKNGNFSRTINGETINLMDKEIKGATGAINSVIYFATLPYKLNDVSVNKEYMGDIIIKNINYNVLSITFKEEGGGEDFEDQFYYWINKETKKIDYLAYNYKVNNGGVRFRSAYNRRVVDGITFQDYINYKADVKTPLEELPKFYELGKLKELSKIKTENIINLNNK